MRRHRHADVVSGRYASNPRELPFYPSSSASTLLPHLCSRLLLTCFRFKKINLKKTRPPPPLPPPAHHHPHPHAPPFFFTPLSRGMSSFSPFIYIPPSHGLCGCSVWAVDTGRGSCEQYGDLKRGSEGEKKIPTKRKKGGLRIFLSASPPPLLPLLLLRGIRGSCNTWSHGELCCCWPCCGSQGCQTNTVSWQWWGWGWWGWCGWWGWKQKYGCYVSHRYMVCLQPFMTL